MNAIELFAGAGGLSLGLRSGGFHIAAANEMEPDFAETFALNHPETQVIRDDIRNVNFEKVLSGLGVSDIAMVSGGPPCQGFSTVGSKNKDDPRNSLLYEYIRAVASVSPSYVLFENVSGFKTMYAGQACLRLLEELDALGYESTSGIIDASEFGLPQIRKRTIIIGWKRGLPPVQIPAPTHSDSEGIFNYPLKLTIMDAISDLPEIAAGESADYYLTEPQNEFQRRMRAGCAKLTEHNAARYGKKMQ